MLDYERYDALGLAELVRRGDVSPLEVVDAAIERIDRLNPLYNAIVTHLREPARRAATGTGGGPFWGVPMLLKDLLGDIEGVETRSGSRFKAGFPARRDHTLVQRYRDAGFLFLGKTNVPELGMLPSTEGSYYGAARNPWNSDYSTGGSSGGSAAAVALGMVPVAHGGDAGGSIRMPASCCGVVGLKPTRGRNPCGPDLVQRTAGFLEEHVLTRTVRDCAAVLDVTHGPEIGDGHVAPAVDGSFLDQVGRDPGRLRIAVTSANLAGEPAQADCQDAVDAAARELERLGHLVEPASLPLDMRLIEKAMVIGAAFVAHELDGHGRLTGKRPTPDLIGPGVWALYEAGKKLSAGDYIEAVEAVQTMVRQMGRFMERYDVWMTPTVNRPPLRLGVLEALGGEDADQQAIVRDFMSHVIVANATGQPSMSLPLHWTGEGLPIGVLINGRFGDEATLLRLAAQLESTVRWSERRIPVVAPRRADPIAT